MKPYDILAIGELNVDLILNNIDGEPEVGKEKFAGDMILTLGSSTAIFAANAAAYTERLAALDGEYQAAVDASPVHTLLFGDRFPFRYLVEDYGLDYYAAFPGCSAETEASFETIAFLAGKVKELDLPAVLAIENSDHRVAGTIAQNAGNGAKVLTLDSMQGVTGEDAAAGTTYLSIMESNLEVLKQALA